VSSSIKFKENVIDITEEESGVLDFLCPVSFNYKSQTKKTLGLIAEEVELCYPEMCIYHADGKLLTVDYIVTQRSSTSQEKDWMRRCLNKPGSNIKDLARL
jgi:hypothetical protein